MRFSLAKRARPHFIPVDGQDGRGEGGSNAARNCLWFLLWAVIVCKVQYVRPKTSRCAAGGVVGVSTPRLRRVTLSAGNKDATLPRSTFIRKLNVGAYAQDLLSSCISKSRTMTDVVQQNYYCTASRPPLRLPLPSKQQRSQATNVEILKGGLGRVLNKFHPSVPPKMTKKLRFWASCSPLRGFLEAA